MKAAASMLFSLLLLAPQWAWACGVSAGLQRPPLLRAGFSKASLLGKASLAPSAEPDALTITFIGHATFEIETPGHVRVVTDYNGVNIPADVPDIITMNHAHSTHYTDHPDPRIPTVLRGWRDDGKPPQIEFSLRDLRIHNLPTNIREWGGSGTEYYGNSIFVFESAGLCVAHLSHLHHLLTPDDLAQLGEIDVVMAPVDGIYTLSHDDMASVLDALHPRLVLPMHAFGPDILRRFLDRMRDHYSIRTSPSPTITVSRATLPATPEIVVLPGPFF